MKITKHILKKIRKRNYIYNFELYHTIGINSRPNFNPMFYGCYTNDKPKEFIYSSYKRNNFTIISNLAECDKELSFYGINRSNIMNLEHNLQISCNEIINIDHYKSQPRCIGRKQHHEWQLEYLEKSLLYYNNIHRKTFSYTSFIESHDPSFISITRVDDDFAKHLMKLYSTFV